MFPEQQHEMEAEQQQQQQQQSQQQQPVVTTTIATTTAAATKTTTTTTSGIAGTSFTLLNNILGAGIIGIPYAIRQSGFVAGIVLFLLVTYLTDKSLRVLIEAAYVGLPKGGGQRKKKKRRRGGGVEEVEQQEEEEDTTEETTTVVVPNSSSGSSKVVMSYEDLASRPFGPTGRTVMSITIFIGSYGSMIAYLMIIKDTVPALLGIDEGVADEIILLLSSLCIVVPLSMPKDLASLSSMSFVSVMADVVLVLLVAILAPIRQSVDRLEGGFWIGILQRRAFNPTGIFVALGIISFAMACQGASFVIYESLTDRNPKRWAIVSGLSVTIASALSLTMGISGYLGFVDETRGDVLLNFERGTAIIGMARTLLCITVFLTYPMASFVCRHVLLSFLDREDEDDEEGRGRDGTIGREEHGEFAGTTESFDDESVVVMGDNNSNLGLCHNWRSLLPPIMRLDLRKRLTLALYVGALLPALAFDDLGPVLSVLGAIGGSIRNYIAPGMIYLGVHGDEFLSYANGLLLLRAQQSLSGYVRGSSTDVAAAMSFTHDDDGHKGVGEVELPSIGTLDEEETISPEGTRTDLIQNGTAEPVRHSGRTMELPLDGTRTDSVSMEGSNDRQEVTVVANRLELPLEGTKRTLTQPSTELLNRHKPVWWYILGFPLWCAIAARGSAGMKKGCAAATTTVTKRGGRAGGRRRYSTVPVNSELHDDAMTTEDGGTLEQDDDGTRGGDEETRSEEEEELEARQPQFRRQQPAPPPPPPLPRDYFVAIFFILFGIMACTVGLGVNIYKQVKKL